jgi:hypothetical protein
MAKKPQAGVRRRTAKRSARLVARKGGRTAASDPAPLPAEREQLFDEPATPAPRPVVPVEEPVPRAVADDDPERCGSPDETRNRGSDVN